MPRAPSITAAEFGARNPQAKGRYFTNKRGQKVYVAYEKKHKFPQGRGIRVDFKRKTPAGILTNELLRIKRNQERAERRAKIKKGIGLFDNPLSDNLKVIGVKRVVRKQQVEAQIRKFRQAQQQGRTIKLSKKARARLERRQFGSFSRSSSQQKQSQPKRRHQFGIGTSSL